MRCKALLISLLLLCQPMAGFATLLGATHCQHTSAQTPVLSGHAHHAGAITAMAHDAPQAERGCDCGCPCTGHCQTACVSVFAYGTSALALSAVFRTEAVSLSLTPGILPAHRIPLLRPPLRS